MVCVYEHLDEYLVAYCNVRRVSGRSLLAGDTHAIMQVLELPPSESYIANNRNDLSKYTCMYLCKDACTDGWTDGLTMEKKCIYVK